MTWRCARCALLSPTPDSAVRCGDCSRDIPARPVSRAEHLRRTAHEVVSCGDGTTIAIVAVPGRFLPDEQTDAVCYRGFLLDGDDAVSHVTDFMPSADHVIEALDECAP